MSMEVGQYSIYMYVIKWGKVPRIQKVLLKKLKTYLNPHKNLSESSSPFRTSKMHKKNPLHHSILSIRFMCKKVLQLPWL